MEVTATASRSDQVLNLGNKHLRDLDSINFDREAVRSLHELILWNNQLQSLPPIIGTLSNLQRLDLADNALRSLPDSIGNLVNLQELNLENNQLVSLPNSINHLVNLQLLNLSANHLTNFPNREQSDRLTKLRILYLGHNQLTDISSLLDLINLQILYVNNNQLYFIPNSIDQMTGLQTLSLEYNQSLCSLPTAHAVRRLSGLKALKLKGTSLRVVQMEVSDDEWEQYYPGYVRRLPNMIF